MATNHKIPAVPTGRKTVQTQSTTFPLFLSGISSRIIRCVPVVFIISLFVPIRVSHAKAPLPNDGNKKKHLCVEIFQNYPPIYMKDRTAASFHLQLPKKVASQEQRSLGYKYLGFRKNIQQRLQEGQLDIGMGLVPTLERKKCRPAWVVMLFRHLENLELHPPLNRLIQVVTSCSVDDGNLTCRGREA